MANAVIEGKQGESFEPEMEEQPVDEEATTIEEVVANEEEKQKNNSKSKRRVELFCLFFLLFTILILKVQYQINIENKHRYL